MCIYRCPLTHEQRRTFESISAEPPSTNIRWSKVIALLKLLDRGKVSEERDKIHVMVLHPDGTPQIVILSRSQSERVVNRHQAMRIQEFLDELKAKAEEERGLC